MKYIFAIAIATSLLGCASMMKGFNMTPPVSRVEEWSKPGVSNKGIIIALLECGFPSINFREYPMSNIDRAWASYCMENDGFSHNVNHVNEDWRSMCRDGEVLSACLPGAVPPGRDVNRRLNSPFCIDNPEVVICK